eukprot:TRINITY_DN145_c2_g1_i8.p2 TRINITY_DN145_c2_g1~~TRINITY_DN145_c2_g1_i8.p2  ORF type:complete len:119 (-),score=5.22 TRINITY_DN145_c2_g1_i8:715-1071(-)
MIATRGTIFADVFFCTDFLGSDHHHVRQGNHSFASLFAGVCLCPVVCCLVPSSLYGACNTNCVPAVYLGHMYDQVACCFAPFCLAAAGEDLNWQLQPQHFAFDHHADVVRVYIDIYQG